MPLVVRLCFIILLNFALINFAPQFLYFCDSLLHLFIMWLTFIFFLHKIYAYFFFADYRFLILYNWPLCHWLALLLEDFSFLSWGFSLSKPCLSFLVCNIFSLLQAISKNLILLQFMLTKLLLFFLVDVCSQYWFWFSLLFIIRSSSLCINVFTQYSNLVSSLPPSFLYTYSMTTTFLYNKPSIFLSICQFVIVAPLFKSRMELGILQERMFRYLSLWGDFGCRV